MKYFHTSYRERRLMFKLSSLTFVIIKHLKKNMADWDQNIGKSQSAITLLINNPDFGKQLFLHRSFPYHQADLVEWVADKDYLGLFGLPL